MTEGEKAKRAADLAAEIMRLAQNSILLNLRFMSPAVMRLAFSPLQTTYRVDGINIFYGSEYVLKRYLADKNQVSRDVLHMIMHCVFRHAFAGGVDPVLWNIACDIAAESTISSLDIACLQTEYSVAQKDVLRAISAEVESLSAEMIYRYFKDKNLSVEELSKLHTLFMCDDHRLWYNDSSAPADEDEKQKENTQQSEEGTEQQNPSAGSSSDGGEDEENSADEDGGEGETQQAEQGRKGELEKEWEEVSRSIQMDMETFSKEKGETAGEMALRLKEINRDRYDYAAFLRKFAVPGETMKINDDEFDYVFYTYGLELFGNMPLVEPLEYKEDSRVREFVIAVDTSGSTSSGLVKKFLEKTYGILKSTESFFNRINLHIIQCDSAVQEHVKITDQSEFDAYISGFHARGLGGTDFRPVFREVDRMVAEKEFLHLGGLIYFTDGFGTFPERKPKYKTAFVFVQNSLSTPTVPPWAIKLVLEDTEIEQ
ncbi:MAG: metallopeptidase [Clostridia bacterium]|nr:metallopeptidase [Clostridia bacterium]